MSAKHIIRTQTCALTKEERSHFLSTYDIPSEYKIMLSKSNQTIYDSLNGFISLYTHCFSLANLRLPLPKFFCDVLEYYLVHLSRLNPFGCAKLTTFVVMCKACGGEPRVELFRSFFNFYPGGQWLTFAKRPKKHVPSLLPKDNRWDKKSFKYKLPHSIYENPLFQRLEMAFKNFMYAEYDEDMSILPQAEPLDTMNLEQLVEKTADSGGSPTHGEMLEVGTGSIAERMKSLLASVPLLRKLSLPSLGRHLDEIHMTWDLFWKKQDKSATLHNEGLKNCLQKKEQTRLQIYTKSDEENSHTVAGDGVTVFREGVRISRSHEGYRNAIKLPEGAKVSPLRSDTIRLVQNGYAFAFPLTYVQKTNQHIKDFFRIVDYPLTLMVLHEYTTHFGFLFCVSLRGPSLSLACSSARQSLLDWDDLITHFLAQFFPPGRTAKLQKDILMFLQHQDESLYDAWTHFKDLFQKFPHHGLDL
ncbi:zinc finger, CCHC-type containing protein [Tanacetum coccineum]